MASYPPQFNRDPVQELPTTTTQVKTRTTGPRQRRRTQSAGAAQESKPQHTYEFTYKEPSGKSHVYAIDSDHELGDDELRGVGDQIKALHGVTTARTKADNLPTIPNEQLVSNYWMGGKTATPRKPGQSVQDAMLLAEAEKNAGGHSLAGDIGEHISDSAKSLYAQKLREIGADQKNPRVTDQLKAASLWALDSLANTTRPAVDALKENTFDPLMRSLGLDPSHVDSSAPGAQFVQPMVQDPARHVVAPALGMPIDRAFDVGIAISPDATPMERLGGAANFVLKGPEIYEAGGKLVGKIVHNAQTNKLEIEMAAQAQNRAGMRRALGEFDPKEIPGYTRPQPGPNAGDFPSLRPVEAPGFQGAPEGLSGIRPQDGFAPSGKGTLSDILATEHPAAPTPGHGRTLSEILSDPQMSAEGHPFTEGRMNPKDIGVKDGLQYKRDGIVDLENNVTGEFKNVKKYDQATAPPLTVWETWDGKRWVMNGHHRRELAIRTGEDSVPVRIFKEEDGIDFNTARGLGALQNIRDGKGTAIDALNVLQDLGFTESELQGIGISNRSKVGRDAFGLMKLSPESIDLVKQGAVPEEVAAAIGEAKLGPQREGAAMRLAARSGIENRNQAFILADKAREAPLVSPHGQTGDLFGDIPDELAIGEQAKIHEAAVRRLSSDRRLLDAATKVRAVGDTRIDAEAQTQAANIHDFATRVLATDPEAARILLDEATAYAANPTSAKLREATDRVVRAALEAADRRVAELSPQRGSPEPAPASRVHSGTQSGFKPEESRSGGLRVEQGPLKHDPEQLAKKSLGELTPSELDDLREAIRRYERGGAGDAKTILGDRYPEWKKLENGSADDMAAAEAMLSPQEWEAIYGAGPYGHSLEDIDDFLTAVNPIHFADSPEELGAFLRNKLVNPEQHPDLIMAAVRKINQEGWDPMTVIQSAGEAFARNLGGRPGDYAEAARIFDDIAAQARGTMHQALDGGPGKRTPWTQEHGPVVSHRKAVGDDKLPGDLAKALRRGKNGDMGAADALVDGLWNPRAVDQVRKLVEKSPDEPIILTIRGENRIPEAFGSRLADELGLEFATVTQPSSAQKTSSGWLWRLFHHAEFSGKIEAGRSYILADDFLTMGGTMSDFRAYVEGQGGKVVGATSLQSKGGVTIEPDAAVIDVLKKMLPDAEANWRQRMGYDLDGLTYAEANMLLKKPDTFKAILDGDVTIENVPRWAPKNGKNDLPQAVRNKIDDEIPDAGFLAMDPHGAWKRLNRIKAKEAQKFVPWDEVHPQWTKDELYTWADRHGVDKDAALDQWRTIRAAENPDHLSQSLFDGPSNAAKPDPERVSQLALLAEQHSRQFPSEDPAKAATDYLVKAYAATKSEVQAAIAEAGLMSNRNAPKWKQGSLIDNAELDGQGSLFQRGSNGKTADPIEMAKGFSSNRIDVDPIPTEKPKAITDIFQDFTRGVGKKVTFGKTPRRSYGAYFTTNSAAVIRGAGDLDAMAHELAHAFDDSFKITDGWINQTGHGPYDSELFQAAFQETTAQGATVQIKRAEAFAEYVTAWVKDPAKAEALAPKFTNYFRQKVDDQTLTALRQFSTDIREWAGSPAAEQILSGVRSAKPPNIIESAGKALAGDPGPGFGLSWLDRQVTAVQDHLRPLVASVDYLKTVTGSGELKPSEDPVVLARLLAGHNGKVADVFEHGMIGADFQRVTPGGFKWLFEGLDTSSKKVLSEEIDLVRAYMIAERTLEKGLQFNRTENVSGIGHGVKSDVEVAMKTILDIQTGDPARFKRISEAASRYREWADSTLQYMVEKGRLSKSQYNAIKEANEFYVSMQRVMETAPGEDFVISRGRRGRKLGSVSETVKKLKGSSRDIKDPYVSLMEATSKAIFEADRNEVMLSLRDLLDTGAGRGLHVGDPIDLASVGRRAKVGEANTVSIFVDGEKELWQLHPDVYAAVKGLTEADVAIPKIFTMAARLLRAGITKHPAFVIRNKIRDIENTLVISEHTATRLKQLFHPDRSGELRKDFQLAGGDQAGFYAKGPVEYYKQMHNMMDDLTRRGVRLLDPRRLSKAYNEMLEWSERSGRLAEFQAARTDAIAKGMSPKDAQLYAAAQARDLQDFAVHGGAGWMKMLTQTVPFTNASIQGLSKGIRAATSSRKATQAFAAKWLLFAGVPTITELYMHKQAGTLDEYRQLPAWQRDMFYNFKLNDTWYSVPKPFELGVLATGLQRVIDKEIEGNPNAMDGFGASVVTGLSPLDEKDAISLGGFGPLIETIANYSFFKQAPIVPPFEEGRAINLRNSKNRASGIATWLSNHGVDADPRKIDHIIRGYLGHTGSTVMQLSDIGNAERHQPNAASLLGFQRPDPVTQANDVKWIGDKAEELGIVPGSGREWQRDLKQLRKLMDLYFDLPEGPERREAGVAVRQHAAVVRTRWKQIEPVIRSYQERKAAERNAD